MASYEQDQILMAQLGELKGTDMDPAYNGTLPQQVDEEEAQELAARGATIVRANSLDEAYALANQPREANLTDGGYDLTSTISQYNQKAQEFSAGQQAELDTLKDYIQKYSEKKPAVDWTAAAGWIDYLNDNKSNLQKVAQNYKGETEDEKTAKLFQLQNMLQQRQNDISRQNLENLRSQLQAYSKQKEVNPLQEELLKSKINLNKAMASGRPMQEKIKATDKIEKQAQDHQKNVGDMPVGIKQKIDLLNQTIPGGIYGEGSVPGTGFASWATPDFLQSNEASAVQQSARGLVADLIKLQSGAAATDVEVEKKLKEMGMTNLSKPETFRRGLRNVTEQLEKTLKNKEAGIRPEAKALYRERGGLTSEDINPIQIEKLKRLEELRKKAGK